VASRSAVSRWFLYGAGYWLATFAAFPHPLFGGVVDLGIVASWLPPMFLLLAIDGCTPRMAALRGLGLGLLAHASVLHWAYVVTVHYGGAHPLLGLLAPPGMALYPAAFTAGFAAVAAALARRGVASLFVLAALWVVFDHGRSWVLGGFPWATLGYAQHANRLLLGIVTVTGVYGLSFVVALGGAMLARLVRHRALGREGAVAVLTIVVLHAIGPWLRAPELSANAPTVRIAAVQGNVDQGEKWSPRRFDETLRDYEAGTRAGASQGARIVVWPESAVTVAVEYEREVQARLEALAQETGTALVFGSVGAGKHPEGGVAYYDSAFVLGSTGKWIGRYDKTHLVPFGEYVPLRWLIGRIASAIARGISNRDLARGPAPTARTIPAVPLATSRSGDAEAGEGAVTSARVGIPICYELLFPNSVRRFVGDGAGVLLAVTNDAWYGRTGAPYQFLAMTALRSAETGVWTVRAANTGVSAVIDASGRVRDATRIFESAVLVADVPLRSPDAKPTFYVRHGDAFVVGCAVGVGMAVGWALRRGRRTGHGELELANENQDPVLDQDRE